MRGCGASLPGDSYLRKHETREFAEFTANSDVFLALLGLEGVVSQTNIVNQPTGASLRKRAVGGSNG